MTLSDQVNLVKGFKMEKLIKEEMESLIKEFKTRILTEKMVCEILNKSSSTLGRWRKKGVKLSYKKTGDSKNTTIEYTVRSVAEYIVQNDVQIN